MKVVAVLGASRDRRKFGNKAVRAFQNRGYDVVPINPCHAHEVLSNSALIEGLRTYGSVLDVPRAIDMATFYVPPNIGEEVVSEMATKGVPEIWINPGADSRELIARAHALGLKTKLWCSIVAIGETPSDYE